MAKKESKRRNDDCALDMTPMIDVVFQLIIFFVVTLKTAATVNPDIVLEYGRQGPKFEPDKLATPPITIEVKRYFRHTKFFGGTLNRPVYSLSGAVLSVTDLKRLMKQTVARRGTNVTVLIRADKDAHHEDVRQAMNACTEAGIWNVSFLAVKKPAAEK